MALCTERSCGHPPFRKHRTSEWTDHVVPDPLWQEAGARSNSRSGRAVSPKVVSRNQKNKRKYVTDKQTTDEKVRNDQTSSLPAVKLEYAFGQRLKDAQRVEDLFELVRDAERLNATEVALLPVTLMQLYQNRSAKEQQAMTTHLFFDGIAKPWALEPAKLDAEEQLMVLSSLLQMNSWNPGAGRSLMSCVFSVSRAVAYSLETAAHKFSPSQLIQVLVMCNSSSVLRQASPQLAAACIAACVRSLESLSPDQLSQSVFLSAQSGLRLNVKCPDKVKQLIHVGVARAEAMSALSLSQFMFGVAAVRGTKESHMQKLTSVAATQAHHFKAPALKNVLWSLGTTSFSNETLLLALETQLFRQSPHLTASHISTAIWAFGRVSHLPDMNLMQELSNQAMLKSSSFTAMQTRQLLWGYYTLRYFPPDALLEALAKKLTSQISSMEARSLSGLIWAFGGLNYEPNNMQLFLEAAQERSWQMNNLDVSQCMRGLANLRLPCRSLVQALVARAFNMLDTFNTQGLANLAWSMAHLDFKHEGVLDAIVMLIVEDLEDANARDVTELISALAILNHTPSSKHMDALAHHMIVLLSDSDIEWSLQDLSTSCWALARLNIGNRKLLDLIYNRILVDIPILSAKDISYQLWGFAALGYPLQSNVLNVYLARLLKVLDDMDPVDLSHIMWALFNYNNNPEPAALDAFLAVLPSQLDNTEPAVVATVAHACGELYHHPSDAFLDSLEQHAVQRSGDYSCADWSALLQAFSRLQAQPKHLFPALLQEVQSGRLEVDSRLMGDCLSILSLFKAWQEPLYDYMLLLRRQMPLAAFTPRCLRQICQAHVLAKASSGAAVVELPDSIRVLAEDYWYRSQLPFNPTQLVDELCDALDSMDLQHQEGIPIAEGLLRIDIALPEQKVAIETLGPLKVLRNRDMLTGRAAYRQQLLTALGWQIIQIRKSHWDALGSFEAKKQHLAVLLSEMRQPVRWSYL